MPKSHPPYAPEFRRQMVELVRSGRTPEELSREFEPTAQAIWNWVRQAERDAGRRDDGLPEAERAELARLRRENRQLRQECELLARRRFGSQAEARMAVFRFIEGWYTLARRHSGLGYLSPIAYEEMMQAEP